MNKNKNNNKNYLSLLFLLIILIFIFIFFLIIYFKNYNENFNIQNNSIVNNRYYRCDNKILGHITQSIFEKNNIIRSNEDWNIYIPCGYNDVEEELKKIKVNENEDISNKYIFGINGCDSIVSKNKIWESLVKCYGRDYAKRIMPESYILDNLDEMQFFLKEYNKSNNNIYILKKNVQRKEGLKLTRDYFEIINASRENYRIVQKYIKDLYLINERKINLRIYLLIILKDNNIYFYLSKNGKCIYTNKKYNDNDLDFESNITSYNLDMNVYKENPRDFQQLKKYLDKDKNNNGTLLFNNIDLLMKEISICLSKNLYQSKNINGSITFQLFGADVIFNKELHPYLLEMNKGPDMTPRDDLDKLMKNNVQNDMFKTVGILKNNENNSFYMIYKNKIINKNHY